MARIPYFIDGSNFEFFSGLYAESPESYTLDGMIDQATAASFMVDGAPALEVANLLPGWQVLSEEQLQSLEEMMMEMSAG